MTSPFAQFANATLTFSVPTGVLEQDANGNMVPSTTSVVVTAMFTVTRSPFGTTRARVVEFPGKDVEQIFLQGYAVNPTLLPDSINSDVPCSASWDGREGAFYLEFQNRDPFGAYKSTGDELNGWFVPTTIARNA
ncbi:MAG: hypothetical protein AAF327_15845 [Cyanobacteria bacterium P01_A01_bin.37]